jgi:signal transduction histidine kinase
VNELFLILKVITCLASVALASMIFNRDPGLRLNRLMAMIPLCTAVWSLSEVLWNLQAQAEDAARLLRLGATGWMMLGSVALHVFSELGGGRKRLMRRLVPISYAASLAGVLLYNLTPLGLEVAVPADWGWSFRFGPAFPLVYCTTVAPLIYVLIHWGEVLPDRGTRNERRVWLSIYVAVICALSIASVTDVALPLFDISSPPMGSTSIALVVLGVTVQFRRYGYSILTPGAFATEILDTLADGVVLLGKGGRIRMANGAFARLAQMPGGKLRGVEFDTLIPRLPSHSELFDEEVETELIAANAERIPVLVTPTQLPWAAEGGRTRALMVRDLREVGALRDRLVSSERLAAVGELSSSVVEEIMEPIDGMRSHLEGLRAQCGVLRALPELSETTDALDELMREREELVDECIEGVDRIAIILHDVHGFSRGQSTRRERVDMNRLAANAVRIASARAAPGVGVEQDLDATMPVVCTPDEIVQVIVNLLVNAFHALGKEGNVQISSRREGQDVHLRIQDDGAGIPSDVIDHIFDPFFTTKQIGEGTGLGLAICQHIVRHHDGELRVDSEEGQGARFTLVLPGVDADTATGDELVAGS